MKKTDNSIYKTYSPLKLYMEDLEKIEEVLKEAANDVSIKTDDYEYESIKELCDHFITKSNRIKRLKFETKSPYGSVEFKESDARIYFSSSDKDAGLFFKLDQIISCKTRKPKWLYSIFFSLLFPLFFGFVVSFFVARTINSIFLYSFLITYGITSCLTWWAMFTDLRRHSIISLNHKKSWFAESIDKQPMTFLQIILTILMTLVGLFGGWLIRGYFIQCN